MINYHQGDATSPDQGPKGPKLIIHVCNDVGAWGAGFVLALSKRWPQPEAVYRVGEPKMGEVQFVQVEEGVIVCNMVAQVLDYRQGPNIRYMALAQCLEQVATKARELGATVHGPRFGAGLAGGDWKLIEQCVERTMGDIPVYIYDLPARR